MSEYQYYEFRAVDRPLTRAQMSELRDLSSRAQITPTSFSNTYNYGDLHGDPRKLVESYFDAHVYVSNFGMVTFMLRLPRTALPDDILARYATNEGLDWWATEEHTILEWRLDDEPSGEWVDGEGWMGQLLPIRDELVRGDYRSLYIGWLSDITSESGDEEDEEDEEDEYEADEEEEAEDEDSADLAAEDEEDEDSNGAGYIEPPVPAGLGSLTAAQAALAEFLGVGSDLITAAATASPALPSIKDSDQGVDEWVARLPDQEVRAIVARIIRGEGLRIQTELQSRYYRTRSESEAGLRAGADSKRRTGADLLALAETTARERKRQEAEERERKRHAQLAALMPRFSELWATVNSLAEEKNASAYDKIRTLLVDMRDAYGQAGRRPEFDAEFARFVDQHSRSTALIRRLREVRLIS